MSFLRHEEIYRSDVRPGYSWSGNPWSPPQRSSAAMSFQSAIPWRVALRQSPPPLHRLATILNNPLRRTMIFQRTATTPLTSCLSPRVHSTRTPTPSLSIVRKWGEMGSASAEYFLGNTSTGDLDHKEHRGAQRRTMPATTSGCFPATIASFMIRGNFLAHKNVVVVCC
jgi:hypothetical protein